jgi:hypothetical protein
MTICQSGRYTPLIYICPYPLNIGHIGHIAKFPLDLILVIVKFPHKYKSGTLITTIVKNVVSIYFGIQIQLIC